MDEDQGLREARKAVDNHEWADAVASLRAADAIAGLSPEDLELLSEAAFWAGQVSDAIEARQRAHAAYADRGRRPRRRGRRSSRRS